MPVPLADLTGEQLKALCASKSGKYWKKVLGAFADFDVDGELLSEHVHSVDALHSFLKQELQLHTPQQITKQLHKLLSKHGGAADGAAGGGGGAAAGGGGGAAAGGGGGAPAAVGAEQQRVSLCVRVQDTVSGAVTKITLDCDRTASVAAVQRRLLERMGKCLTTHVHLLHAGRRIAAGAVPDWADFSVVHAVLREETTPLTLGNMAHHPITATHVVLESNQDAQPPRPEQQARAQGITLRIFDNGVPMGNGAYGAVFKGVVDDGVVQQPVAVKKFHPLENPMMWGLGDAGVVGVWVNREMLPEVNLLAGLAHPNVVRLCCVGLGTVHGTTVPTYVAMDLCKGGTLEAWMHDDKVTDVYMPAFLRDIIDGMEYLHSKRIIHRDLKPDNLLVQTGNRGGERPRVVVADVGLAKKVTRTMAAVSAAGAVAYRAPEAMADASRCTTASDVYVTSLVAVELVTGTQVYTACHDDGDDRADADAAKRALVEQAKAKMASILEFADDSGLTVEAANMLLEACTVGDPRTRPSFKSVVVECIAAAGVHGARRQCVRQQQEHAHPATAQRQTAACADVRKAQDRGDVEAVVQVLRDHAGNAAVVQKACGALNNMTANAANTQQAGACGGVEVVVQVLRDHADNAGVVTNACAALWNITVNDDNKQRAGACGGVEVVVQALRDHSGNVGVSAAANGALRVLRQ